MRASFNRYSKTGHEDYEEVQNLLARGNAGNMFRIIKFFHQQGDIVGDASWDRRV